MKTKIKYSRADTTREVAIARCSDGPCDYLATIDDASNIEVEVESTGESGGWLRIGGRVHRYQAVRRDRQLLVWLGGKTYTFEVEERSARRAGGGGSAAGSNEIKAPMPGTILKINVSPGDNVEANQAVVVMESMKMEMTLSATVSGKVKDVTCKVGELVEMDRVLVALEPSTDE